MIAEQVLFWVFALGTLVSAGSVIVVRNPVASAMALVASFFFLAGIYVLLWAHTIAVLQVHGTLDAVIGYLGGATVGQPPYPSAKNSVRTWGAKNRCTGANLTAISGDLDLVTALLGDETEREGFTGGPSNAAAELWTMRGAGHVPVLNDQFAERVYSWLLAHPKP